MREVRQAAHRRTHLFSIGRTTYFYIGKIGQGIGMQIAENGFLPFVLMLKGKFQKGKTAFNAKFGSNVGSVMFNRANADK
jgi:hypothetical protein